VTEDETSYRHGWRGPRGKALPKDHVLYVIVKRSEGKGFGLGEGVTELQIARDLLELGWGPKLGYSATDLEDEERFRLSRTRRRIVDALHEIEGVSTFGSGDEYQGFYLNVHTSIVHYWQIQPTEWAEDEVRRWGEA
jgi:hypothetical protein